MAKKSIAEQQVAEQQQQQQFCEEDNRIRLAVYNLHKEIRIYHVGVLVRGKEFHYGIKIGLFTTEPRNGGKAFRVRHFNLLKWQMKFLRHVDLTLKGRPLYTELSLPELLAVQEEMRPRYNWSQYNPISHNCMDYAMQFVRRISAIPLPKRNFFALRQEIRQPLIAMPLRLAWKALMKITHQTEKEGKDAEKNAAKRARKEKRASKKGGREAEKQHAEESREDGERQTVRETGKEERAPEMEEEEKEELEKDSQQDSGNVSENSADAVLSSPKLFITTIQILPNVDEVTAL